MKELLKKILKTVHLYHPMQLFYRQTIFNFRKIYFRTIYKKYKGKGFTCNVCGSSYTRFVPDYPSRINKSAIANNHVIAGYGRNIFCPHCLSTARERLVIAMLAKSNLRGIKTLHLSPEKNVYNFLKGMVDIVTGDLNPGFYKNIDTNVKTADATRLRFENESFDLVIGNHILEHIPDDIQAIKEIYRVLKKNGIAVLQVPFSTTIQNTMEEPLVNDSQRQSQLFGQKDHVRIYNRSDYMKRLMTAGFIVEYIPHESLHELHPYAIQPGEGFFSIRK
jgi:SAM-dependent methyltransferase